MSEKSCFQDFGVDWRARQDERAWGGVGWVGRGT